MWNDEAAGRHGRAHGHHGRGGRPFFGVPERPSPFGDRGGPGWGGHHHGGRARRGEARYLLLDALRDGPKHGYEIIKALEERSAGLYAPSAGTVYPTLQYLEDLGLVRAEQEGERKVYHLTDAGRAELDSHAEEVAAFWGRFAAPTSTPAGAAEMGFLRDEWNELTWTVWGGQRAGWQGAADPAATSRAVRQALERCKNEVRAILAAGGGAAQTEVI
jgi:DNA-binding PadR family transcriptional regulator